MTVSELRTLVDNLDEYIHIPGGIDRLKKMILHLAVSGQLVPQDPSEGTGEELYRQIQVEKSELIKQGKIKKQKPLMEISEDEVPFALPMTWKWARLGDLNPDYQNGLASRGEKIGEATTVLRLADIKNRQISLEDTRELIVSNKNIEKYQVSMGDMLITRVNGSADIVGQFTLCDKRMDAIYCDHFIRMRVSKDLLLPEFLYILGDSSLLRHKIKNLFITTAGQKTINQGHINSLLIPLAPLLEQKRIVAKVNGIFALIDQLNEVYKSEEAERSKLVASSLTQFTRGDDRVEKSLALAYLSEIIRTKADATELRGAVSRLVVNGSYVKHASPMEIQQAIDLNFGTRITKKEHEGERYPVYGGGGESFRTDCYNRKNEWVISRFAMSKECVRYVMGEFFMLDSGFTINIKQEHQSYLDKDYVGHCLLGLQSEIYNTGRGMAQKNIDIARFREIKIPVPPLVDQKRIVAKTTQLLNLVSELEAHLEK